MKDLRKKSSLPVKGHFVKAGLEVNENSVKEMLTFMGVQFDDTMVQEAIGYLSSNGMQINMNNLYDYLKSKSIMSNATDKRLKKK